MRRAALPLLALLPVAILVGSCVGTESPTGVGDVELAIPINPALIPTPADGGAADINRIRARVTRVPDNVILAEATIDVSPTAQQWEISVYAPVGEDGEQVMIYVYLIHADGDTETIEFSGLVGPVDVTSSTTNDFVDVPIIRGPVANFYVTDVTITSAPTTMVEGSTATLEADATSSESAPPTVYWTVLDSSILSADAAEITALAPGVGRVVASAYTYTDTASITVTPAPAEVLVSPDTAFVVGAGAQATFLAAVVDARGDTIPGETVTWSSGSPLILSSLGGGLFEALDVGDGTVAAASSSDPSVVGSAVMSVAAEPADVVVTKSVTPAAAREGDTVDFEIVVTNAGRTDLVGIAVSDSLPSGLTHASSSPAGAFDTPTGTWTWSLGSLAAGASDTIAVRASVDLGIRTATLTNVALASPPSGFADTVPADNRATASLDVTPASTDRVDLQVQLSVSDATPADGDTIQVTVQVDNLTTAGSVPATSIVVGTAATPEVNVLDGSASQGTYDVVNDLWSVGTLDVDSSAVLSLDVEIPLGLSGQSILGVAWVVSVDQAQSVLANDTSTVQLSVVARRVDVEILKTVDEPQPLADSPVTFTVSVVNHGPGPVSDVLVFDTLDSSAFVSPSHAVTAGFLDGDSIWSIASLAEGDTATWTTNATTGANVTGGSATNTAFLLALAETDTVPANDIAVVAMSFPVTTVPDVQITAPADGSVYDPGDLVTFSATATDAEDGDRSAFISWTSTRDGQLATGPSFETDRLTTGLHEIVASATDSDGGTGADTIQITVALITTPAALNVPFGGTASLPITLSEPAPTGGLTLSVTSRDPGIAAPAAATVFIAAGSQSANATLSGVQPGVTDVSVSHPAFGTAVSVVSVTAALNILQTNFTMGSAFTEDLVIRFESQGVAIAAPTGGLPVTLTSADPTCVTGPSVTIPGGQISATSTVAYGGSATLPCSAFVVASAAGVVSDSLQITVIAPPAIFLQSVSVGSGLQRLGSFSVPLSNHGGVGFTLRTSDPQILRLSPDASTPGADSIVIDLADGLSSRNFYLQGVEGATGTVTLTVSAAGFATTNVDQTVVQPGVSISGLGANTTTLTAPDDFYAFVGIPSGNGVNAQQVRAGGAPVTITFTVDSTQVGILVDATTSAATLTAVVPVGDDNSPTTVGAGGVAHDPIGVGTQIVRASAPGFISTPSATFTVGVTAPPITAAGRTVGSGLQTVTSFSLGAVAPDSLDVVIRSANPQVMLVSPDVSTPGADSILIRVPPGTASGSFYVQGVESAVDTASVLVSAPDYTAGAAVVTVVQPGVIISGLSASSTTLTARDDFYAFIGYPSGSGVSAQAVRAGGVPVTVTFTADSAQVGRLTDGTITGPVVTAVVPVGDDNSPTTVATGGVAHEPLGEGTQVVTATAPGFVSTPSATRTVAVTAPGITMGTRTVGSGLQSAANFNLGAPVPDSTDVVVRSEAPQVVLVSPDVSTPGTDSIVVRLPTGTTGWNYYVQALEGAVGTASVTVRAPGYVDGVATMTVVQPGIIVAGLNATTTTLSADDEFYAFIGYPSGSGVSAQSIRAGGQPVTVSFTADSLQVGVLTDGTNQGAVMTAVIPVGDDNSPTTIATGGVAHDPVAEGMQVITASAPGFAPTPTSTRNVAVTTPGITTPTRTVGSGLQVGSSFSLGAPAVDSIDVVVRSSDPGSLLVSPNVSTTGTDSIVVRVPPGQSSGAYYVQGLEGAVANPIVTVSAPGYTNGTTTVAVVQPGVIISGLSTSISATAADDDFYAFVGYPSGSGVSAQLVRAGGAPITITFTIDNTSLGVLTDGSTTGASVTAVIPVGDDNSPTTVAAGGVAHDPVAAGSVTISASGPGLIQTPSAVRAVTITQ